MIYKVQLSSYTYKVSLKSNRDRIIFYKRTTETKKEFRIFNDANDCQFESIINNESWEGIDNVMDAQTQYDKFNEINIRHYNNSYPIKKTE